MELIKAKYEERTVTDVCGMEYHLRVMCTERKNYNAILALEMSVDYKNVVFRDGFDADTFEEAVNEAGIQISSSCPPKDAVSVDEINNLSDDELVKRINEVAKQPKKLIYMFAFGYAFRWEEFKTIARTKGFINISDSKQKPIYVLPNGLNGKEEKLPANQPVNKLDLQDKKIVEKIEIHSKDLASKEYPNKIRNMLSAKAFEDLNFLTKGLSKKERGRVVAELLEMQIAELVRMKEAGELEIYRTKNKKVNSEEKI